MRRFQPNQDAREVHPSIRASSAEHKHVFTDRPASLSQEHYHRVQFERKIAKRGAVHRPPKAIQTFIGTKLRSQLQNYLLLLDLVNNSHGASFKRELSPCYKVFVGKGNNSKVVRSTFSNRFWWKIVSDESEANLIWTQKVARQVFERIHEVSVESNETICQQRSKYLTPKDDRLSDFELILSENERQAFRKFGRNDSWRNYLKSNKKERRKNVELTCNHIQNHRILTNKKNLFHSVVGYCQCSGEDVNSLIPLTFHIQTDKDISQVQDFQDSLPRKEREKLMWIVKPGENSNRGSGIEICKKADKIQKYIQKEREKHPQRTFIVQRYILPFLFHRRKFDIRCFILITQTPHISAYFYSAGYIRTSSCQFKIGNCGNKYIHLTNDAVQKKAAHYSKFEAGNKVTFDQFQEYLDSFHPKSHYSFKGAILPRIRQLVVMSMKATNNFGSSKKEHTFEILGYDFMIDEHFKPWLIEINTNPCLETTCPILEEIIPSMLENAVKIAVDPVFNPPKLRDWPTQELFTCPNSLLEPNRFSLLYSQINP